MRLPVQIAIAFAAFAAVSAVAGALGAANLGTALSFGQMAFAIAASYVIIRA